MVVQPVGCHGQILIKTSDPSPLVMLSVPLWLFGQACLLLGLRLPRNVYVQWWTRFAQGPAVVYKTLTESQLMRLAVP